MRMADIATRLGEQVPALKQVGTAAAYVKAQQGRTALPAAFVLPAEETAQPNPYANREVEQRVGAQFVVMVAARDLSDAKGGATIEALEPVREAVRLALLNWVPDGADAGCEFANGYMFQTDADGVLWWADAYRSEFTIRSE